jgi:hypothetical protein
MPYNARPVYGDETEISELAQRYWEFQIHIGFAI